MARLLRGTGHFWPTWYLQMSRSVGILISFRVNSSANPFAGYHVGLGLMGNVTSSEKVSVVLWGIWARTPALSTALLVRKLLNPRLAVFSVEQTNGNQIWAVGDLQQLERVVPKGILLHLLPPVFSPPVRLNC